MRGVSMKRFGSGRKSDRFGMLDGRRQPGLESGWRQCFDCFRAQASFGAQAARPWRMAMDPIVWILVIDPRTVYWLEGVLFLPLYKLCAPLMLRLNYIR
jgi:hypothetical protein